MSPVNTPLENWPLRPFKFRKSIIAEIPLEFGHCHWENSDSNSEKAMRKGFRTRLSQFF